MFTSVRKTLKYACTMECVTMDLLKAWNTHTQVILPSPPVHFQKYNPPGRVHDDQSFFQNGFVQYLDTSPEMRLMSVKYIHKVKTGDTLTLISFKYGIPIQSIKDANAGIDWEGERRGDRIFAGEELELPNEAKENHSENSKSEGFVSGNPFLGPTVARANFEQRLSAELYGGDNAQSQGGSRGGDELLIELNIKFGVGYESSFNLGGFGVKGKASATMDYMTFRLTEKGFQYIPYSKATIEGSFGHAMLNGGVKMEHNGYNSQWSANGTIANFDLSTGAAPYPPQQILISEVNFCQ